MTLPTRKNIFTIPELVKLIDSSLEPCDCASLARTCHQLFQTLMPLLWERLDGLSWILPLLPALNGGNQDECDKKSITESDLVRFNIYAPWIKHILIYKVREAPVEKNRLDALFAYSAKHVLLPNVMSLKVTGPTDVSWVALCISPSLISLDFTIDQPFNEFRPLCTAEWSLLLYCLAERCPKLQTLSIFPRHFKNESLNPRAELHLSDDSKTTIGRQLEIGLGSFFTNISPLVSLTTSGDILDGACFTAISAWPALESLTIHMNPRKSKYTLPTLDDAAFPALKSLTLYSVTDFKAFQMLWDVPALVSKLTTIKLLPSNDFCYYTNEEFSDTLSQMVAVLVKESPRLEDLWIRLVHPDSLPNYDVPISAFDPLQQLPLRALYIEGIIFEELRTFAYDKEYEQGDLELVNYFSTAFPHIKELGFPTHPVPWSILREFHSKIPKLESLRFDFDISPFSRDLRIELSSIPRHRISPAFTLGANFLGVSADGLEDGIDRLSHEDASFLAKYVFSMWPNAQVAAQFVELVELCGEDDRTPHHKMIELLNKQLDALACYNHDESIRYEDIEVLNEESWTQCSSSKSQSGSESEGD